MFRGGIDYSRWKDIGNDEDDDDDRINVDETREVRRAIAAECSEDASLSTFLSNLATYKTQADELFLRAEQSKDQYDYRVALNEGYQALLAKAAAILRRADIDEDARTTIVSCEIACRLNSACCYLKLLDWENVIEECTWVLTEHRTTLGRQQELRASYFRSYAFLKLHFLVQAEHDATRLKALLEIHNASLLADDAPFVDDYNDLFLSLSEYRARVNVNAAADRIKAMENNRHAGQQLTESEPAAPSSSSVPFDLMAVMKRRDEYLRAATMYFKKWYVCAVRSFLCAVLSFVCVYARIRGYRRNAACLFWM